MSSKEDRLKAIFDRWKEACIEKGDKFDATDGIINEEYWSQPSQKKVLFLLKETNDFKGTNDTPVDLCKYIVKYWAYFWPFVGKLAYGLRKTNTINFPSFDVAGIIENYQSAMMSSAVMNIKKTTGGGSSKIEKLEEAVHKYKDLINEELDIIQPDIIICGGTFQIVKNIIPGDGLSRQLGPDNRCFKNGNSIWIDYYHPSARYPRALMYYGLMSIYQNYLRSNEQELR